MNEKLDAFSRHDCGILLFIMFSRLRAADAANMSVGAKLDLPKEGGSGGYSEAELLDNKRLQGAGRNRCSRW